MHLFKGIFSALVISSFSLAGCVGDSPEGSASSTDGPDPAATSTIDQAVAGTSLTWHPCSSTSCTVPLGGSAGQTCFLAGITGTLATGTPSAPAGVNIVDDGTNYTLYILNPTLGNIGAMTTCITNTANRVTASWFSPNGATQIPQSPTSNRRCFLSGVISYNWAGFSTFASNAHVLPQGNAYYITGAFPAGSEDSIYATCVDASDVGDYSYGNGSSASFFGNLNFNPGGVACGLTGVGGQFIVRTNPGVMVNYNSATEYWNLSVAPSTGAWAECVM